MTKLGKFETRSFDSFRLRWTSLRMRGDGEYRISNNEFRTLKFRLPRRFAARNDDFLQIPRLPLRLHSGLKAGSESRRFFVDLTVILSLELLTFGVVGGILQEVQN